MEGSEKIVSDRDCGEAPGNDFGSSEQPAIKLPDQLSVPDHESIVGSHAAEEMNMLCRRVGALNVIMIQRRRVEKSCTNSVKCTVSVRVFKKIR